MRVKATRPDILPNTRIIKPTFNQVHVYFLAVSHLKSVIYMALRIANINHPSLLNFIL